MICDDVDETCNLDDIPLTCRMLPPQCPQGSVPQQADGCYTGICVTWDECLAGVPPGELCGVRGLPDCPRGSFCDFPPNTMCGASDIPGICMPLEPNIACPDIYAPVCGCDGQTHSNECQARAAGTSVSTEGECGDTMMIECGGFRGLICPDNMLCVDDPTDDCDPNRGGSDCIGICVPER